MTQPLRRNWPLFLPSQYLSALCFLQQISCVSRAAHVLTSKPPTEEDTKERSALQEEEEVSKIQTVPLMTQSCQCLHCHAAQEIPHPWPPLATPQMKTSVLLLQADTNLEFVVLD